MSLTCQKNDSLQFKNSRSEVFKQLNNQNSKFLSGNFGLLFVKKYHLSDAMTGRPRFNFLPGRRSDQLDQNYLVIILPFLIVQLLIPHVSK